MIDNCFLIASLLALIASWNGIFFAIYIHIKFRGYIGEKLEGHRYVDYGLWLSSTQLPMHAHYILFRGRAKRENVDDVYQNLPIKLKRAVLTVYFSMIVSGVALAISLILMEFMG